MSVQWLAWAFQHAEATGGPRLVLLSLANHADESGVCWPSIDTLAREARLSRRRVEQALRELVRSGVVLRQVNGAPVTGHGGYRPNLYRLVKNPVELSTPQDDLAPAESSPPDGSAPAHSSGPDETGPADSRMSGPDDSSTQARTNRPGKPSIEPSKNRQKNNHSSSSPTTALALVTEISTTPAVDEVTVVFEAWVEATGKRRAKLDTKRRRRIVAALRDYPLDDVVAAVRGWRKSPFHCGENADGRRYNELDLLLRDAQHIEQFRDLELGADAHITPTAKPPKAYNAIQAALERRGSA